MLALGAWFFNLTHALFFQPERTELARHAVFLSQLAHPIQVAKALFHSHVEVHPGQFFAEGANVKVALNLAQAGEFLLRPLRPAIG